MGFRMPFFETIRDGHFPNLRSLEIACHGLKTDYFLCIMIGCPKLIKLKASANSLDASVKMTGGDYVLNESPQSWPSLREVTLRGICPTLAGTLSIAGCSQQMRRIDPTLTKKGKNEQHGLKKHISSIQWSRLCSDLTTMSFKCHSQFSVVASELLLFLNSSLQI